MKASRFFLLLIASFVSLLFFLPEALAPVGSPGGRSCINDAECEAALAGSWVCCATAQEIAQNGPNAGICHLDNDNDRYSGDNCVKYFPEPDPRIGVKDCNDATPLTSGGSPAPGAQPFSGSGGGCTKPGGFRSGASGDNCGYSSRSDQLCSDRIDQECSGDQTNLAGFNDCNEKFCADLNKNPTYNSFSYCSCTLNNKRYTIGEKVKCSDYDPQYSFDEQAPKYAYCGISSEDYKQAPPFPPSRRNARRLFAV